jgi:hypothetical protein
MSARRRRLPNDGRSALPNPGDDMERLIRMFAQGLPEALDDAVAARLAARVRPFLTASTSGDEALADRVLTVAESPPAPTFTSRRSAEPCGMGVLRSPAAWAAPRA